jgi:hypothetical protein
VQKPHTPHLARIVLQRTAGPAGSTNRHCGLFHYRDDGIRLFDIYLACVASAQTFCQLILWSMCLLEHFFNFQGDNDRLHTLRQPDLSTWLWAEAASLPMTTSRSLASSAVAYNSYVFLQYPTSRPRSPTFFLGH